MLEKIIFPDAIINLIGNRSVFNLKNKKIFTEWVIARKEKMAKTAIKTPGFLDFFQLYGETAKEELKNRFLDFYKKREDLFQDKNRALFLNAYDKNFDRFIETILSYTPKSSEKSEEDEEKIEISIVKKMRKRKYV